MERGEFRPEEPESGASEFLEESGKRQSDDRTSPVGHSPQATQTRRGEIVGLGLVVGGLLVLAIAAGVAASLEPQPGGEASAPDTAMLYGGHSYLCLEVAATPEARKAGLAGRQEVGPYDGMVFLFPEETPARASFWMKDTRFALDLLFVGTDGRIREVLEMPPCTEGAEGDCPTYAASSPYLFAVEVPAGIAKEFGLAPGTSVELRGACLPVDRD